MKPWLEVELGRIPGRGGLAEANGATLTFLLSPASDHFWDSVRFAVGDMKRIDILLASLAI
jgi:hypothetical protein